MRPVSAESDGPAPPESFLRPLPPAGLLPVSEMSLLHSLGPVQSWLDQELEKCGIDAMIYTRYVLSLLLHDSYDYDLQDQVRLHPCHLVTNIGGVQFRSLVEEEVPPFLHMTLLILCPSLQVISVLSFLFLFC
uniref:Uncharacterized protein n=1 Tax=Esox lucius TaxID=8010 RepID=A0AAY5KR78_ESOLU